MALEGRKGFLYINEEDIELCGSIDTDIGLFTDTGLLVSRIVRQ